MPDDATTEEGTEENGSGDSDDQSAPTTSGGKAVAKLTAAELADLSDEVPPTDWKHLDLWKRVNEALYLLPSHFDFETELRGIAAADIPSANTLLGAGIEDHIPKALNKLKAVWDPKGEYPDYFFIRQPQVFPDVLLRSTKPDDANNEKVLFAIEVKGWYVLSREGVPSARVHVNKNWCFDADMLVVYPWALDSAVAGKAQLFPPFVVGMKKAARLRNQYWIKRAEGNEELAAIVEPSGTPHFHPKKGEAFNDVPKVDSGNFGRIARTGVMDEFMERLFAEERIAGIPLGAWLDFLAAYEDEGDLQRVVRKVQDARRAASGVDTPAPKAMVALADALSEMVDGYAKELEASKLSEKSKRRRKKG